MDSCGKVALECCQIARMLFYKHAINDIAQHTMDLSAVPTQVSKFPPNEERL
jgi:hypothetical protein